MSPQKYKLHCLAYMVTNHILPLRWPPRISNHHERWAFGEFSLFHRAQRSNPSRRVRYFGAKPRPAVTGKGAEKCMSRTWFPVSSSLLFWSHHDFRPFAIVTNHHLWQKEKWRLNSFKPSMCWVVLREHQTYLIFCNLSPMRWILNFVE